VDIALLQLWDSMHLANPTISMTGFLKGVVDAVAVLHPTQVRPGTRIWLHTCLLTVALVDPHALASHAPYCRAAPA
jgi:hypothetical protein